MKQRKLKNRDVNWLYFNERVLLEAANDSTPLLERIKFLAIFSSNLDEYFKVRISQLRKLKSVEKDLRKKLVLKPNKKLKFILKTVDQQQKQFGAIVSNTLKKLESHGIYLKEPSELDKAQLEHVSKWFKEHVQKDCLIIEIDNPDELKDGALYLVIHFSDGECKLVSIPSELHPRFLHLGTNDHNYLYLDDVVKLNLDRLFPRKTILGSYSVKLSRDAELYLEDDFTDKELVEKIYQSLGKREGGQPTRLLYDSAMPEILQDLMKKYMGLGDADMVPGGSYHNFSDFFGFPKISDQSELYYKPKVPLDHPILSKTSSIFEAIAQQDCLVHFPYQRFDTVERFINEAAMDTNVIGIKISLYRIARSSALTDSILLALENNKQVTIFVEAQARFDEENNIKWGRIFIEKGAKVIFSIPNIKVHSKIAMIERLEGGVTKRYAYIGTGNFNAKTAKLYCDHGVFSANEEITADLSQVFLVLERKLIIPKLERLLVSPFTTRSTFLELIENETNNAKNGVPAQITVKMNSLEDSKMIGALYRASENGVSIRLLVRGFCCLNPRNPASMEKGEKPIIITSIIDRYLEHGRIYLFHNGGKEKMYMGSADWMTRNLDRRIEVLTPILDTQIFNELKEILDIQLRDNVKARVIDADDTNNPVAAKKGEPPIRSQYAIYDYLRKKQDETN